MSHTVWVVLVGLTLLGCKSVADPTPTTVASSFPDAAVQPPRVAAPEDVVRMLPGLSGSLPEVPAGALRITVRRETVAVGETEVARLKAGELLDGEASALVRAMSIAGSASRPIAIYVDASLASGAALDVMDAARTSGASALGFVARMGSGELGWLPVRGTTLREDGVPVIRLHADDENFGAVADDSWSKANGTHRLTVRVDRIMDAQALFTALHVLRGPRCADEPGSCRFAALGITADPVARLEFRTLSADGGVSFADEAGLAEPDRAGTGSGQGRRVPRIQQGKATVGPALDKDIIRRIVRAHINEVRHCYKQGLVNDPDLSGEVKVRFSIHPTGLVEGSTVKSTTVSDPKVGTCIAKAVKHWKFPEPTGGARVKVTYPFQLSPG